MRWLTNLGAESTRNEAVCDFDCGEGTWEWLQDKIIGEPKGTASRSVQELKNMDVVGIYEEDNNDN